MIQFFKCYDTNIRILSQKVLQTTLPYASMFNEVIKIMQKDITGFNVRLTEKMAERGVTQADLCRLTGLASSMVSHYCTGQRMPSVPAALKIATVLNTSIDYLAYGDQNKNKKQAKGSSVVSEKGAPYNLRQSRMKRLENEQSLIKEFQALNKEGKAKVFEYIDDLHSTGKYS